MPRERKGTGILLSAFHVLSVRAANGFAHEPLQSLQQAMLGVSVSPSAAMEERTAFGYTAQPWLGRAHRSGTFFHANADTQRRELKSMTAEALDQEKHAEHGHAAPATPPRPTPTTEPDVHQFLSPTTTRRYSWTEGCCSPVSFFDSPRTKRLKLYHDTQNPPSLAADSVAAGPEPVSWQDTQLDESDDHAADGVTSEGAYSGAYSFSDREWDNYQMQLMQEPGEIEAALQDLDSCASDGCPVRTVARQGAPAVSKPAGRHFKWGHCPTHSRALRPKVWLSGRRKGQACLLCSKWWKSDAAGRRDCWYNVHVTAQMVRDSFPRHTQDVYFSLQMRLARAGRDTVTSAA